MSRILKLVDPSILVAGPTSYIETIPHWTPMKNSLDLLAQASLGRFFMNVSRTEGRLVNADGDYDVPSWFPAPFDNTSNQYAGFTDSNGATFVAQARCLVRVSDAAISATPKLRYGSNFGAIAAEGAGTAATISGAAACSATAEDFSGTNSYQTVSITVPSGAKLWKPQVTIAGTGGNPYTFWGLFVIEFFVQLP